MLSGRWYESYPVSVLEGSNTIEFLVPASFDEYINTHETLLSVRIKVVNEDGTAIPATTVITPINNLLSSLFSDVRLILNNISVEGGSSLYPYKSHLTVGLQYNSEVKKCQMRCAGWSEDATARKTWLKGSKSMELVGPLHLDFFNQSQHLLPGVNMRIRLTRAKDEFVVITKKQKVVIEKACLYVRRVRVHPEVLAAHEERLLSENAGYNFQQTEMLTYIIPSGSTSHLQDNLLRGQLPKLAIVGLVPSADFDGTSNNTPLRFKPLDLTQISLQRDGQNVPYSRAIEMD